MKQDIAPTLTMPVERLPVAPSPLSRLVASAAADWRVSQRAIRWLLAAPFLIALAGAGSALLGKNVYKFVVEEDALAETLQVILYAGSLVLSLLFARSQFRGKHLVVAGLYLFVACALVFMIGEELDWGQRIFGWQTPEAMAAINKQKATNLHNIQGVGATFKWVQMMVGAYGAFLPLVLLRWQRQTPLRRFLNKIVPHYSLIPYFALMFFWRLFRNTVEVPQKIYFVVEEYNEVVELVLALGAFLFLVYLLRTAAREAAQATAAKASC